MDGWSPAWAFSFLLLSLCLPFRNWLINFSLVPFSLFPLNLSNFCFPKLVREVPVVKRVVLVFSDGDFLKVPVPEVPVMYHIPGKFLQKASAAFSAVLSGFCTTFTDKVVDWCRSAWYGDKFVCAIDLVTGVTNKRNVCVLAGCWGVGANCGQREFTMCFEEWEVCDESSSKEGVEVKVVLIVAE